MFKSAVYNTVLSPIFSDQFNPNVDLNEIIITDGVKQRKKSDNVSILTMPYCESVMTLALVKVSAYKEKRQIKLKENLLKAIELKQKPGRGKKKEALTEADILIATSVPGQIEAKKRKIAIFKEFETILTGIIREFEMGFIQEELK